VRACERGAVCAWSFVTDETVSRPDAAALRQALERIAGLLEDDAGSVTLSERGDSAAVARHPAFRLFAAMNPATDAGAPPRARRAPLPMPVRRSGSHAPWAELVRRSEFHVATAAFPNTARSPPCLRGEGWRRRMLATALRAEAACEVACWLSCAAAGGRVAGTDTISRIHRRGGLAG